MGVAGRRRLVAQPGGLTLGFALHLIKLESCYRDTHTHKLPTDYSTWTTNVVGYEQ